MGNNSGLFTIPKILYEIKLIMLIEHVQINHVKLCGLKPLQLDFHFEQSAMMYMLQVRLNLRPQVTGHCLSIQKVS